MSSFGKAQEVKEGVQRSLYTGVENFKVVAVNPTKDEIEAIYGREINFDPEYVSVDQVSDADGEREAAQIRLDFYLSNEDDSISTKIQFYVTDTHHKSESGKYRVINSFGRETWLDEDAIKTGQAPSNMSWYNMDGVKVAKRGETQVIAFLVNLLNLPYKSEDPTEQYARIDKEEWAKIFTGDVTLLRNVIESTNNKVGVLLGVKTSGEGKLSQTAFNRSTLRQYQKESKRSDKFKYLLKELKNAKDNGAYGNVDFGAEHCILGEHNITPSTLSNDNSNQTDIFATAPASDDSSADDDWLSA